MDEPSYADWVKALAAEDPRLAEAVAPFISVKHVVDWMQSAGLPLGSFDLVAQDEFCHDGIVPLPDGRHLSFGMT